MELGIYETQCPEYPELLCGQRCGGQVEFWDFGPDCTGNAGSAGIRCQQCQKEFSREEWDRIELAEMFRKLSQETYAIQHDPNCPKPFLVRLVGWTGKLDFNPNNVTQDIVGKGRNLLEATDNAFKEKRRKSSR